MSDCIFCKLANKEIPTEIIYENEYVVAFPDANPVAKVHVLIVPKLHVSNIFELSTHPQRKEIMDGVSEAIGKVAEICDTKETFRIVVNNGAKAGQSVFHLHFHLLGGQELPLRLA